jgi:hypothetical protein
MNKVTYSTCLVTAFFLGSCSTEDKGAIKTTNKKLTSTEAPPSANAENDQAFQANLLPVIKNNCASCHAESGRGTAPSSIYQVKTLETLAKSGTSGSDNELLKKIQGKDHGGGNVCLAGLNSPPCSIFMAWAANLYKTTTTTDPTTPGGDPNALPVNTLNYYGYLRGTKYNGNIEGFAFNAASPTTAITVEIYRSAYTPGATPFASAPANQFGSAGVEGNHRFVINVASLVNSKDQLTVYVYAVIGDQRKQLKDGQATFTVYKPTVEGRSYFEGTTKPVLVASCVRAGCHSSRNFEDVYDSLLTPTPAAGGGPTANDLYRKVSGGIAHRGGAFCTANANVCTVISTWHQKEIP